MKKVFNPNPIVMLMIAPITLILSACHTEEPRHKRPNIIFIMSDDHAYQAIGAYGSGLNETPNIDRLAKEGAIFTKAFVANSICAPSRATVLTGKHSFINGKVDNVLPYNWDQDNFPKRLQQAGYQTALVGKIHLDGRPQGFDYSAVLPGQGDYYNPDFLINGENKRIEGYCTDITTGIALDWLKNKRDKSKPFCLMYHQKAPHHPWMPALKYLNLYDDITFDPPANFFDDYEGRGTAAKTQEMQIATHFKWGYDFKFEVDPNGDSTIFANSLKRMTEKQQRDWRAAYQSETKDFLEAGLKGKELAIWKFNRFIKDYLRCVKSVDDGVGEVLDYLDKNGLSENTIVVYTSDQGFFLGEHGWANKRFMYEESFRTPLLVRYPKEIKPGTVIGNLVQNIDFAPSFLDYAGIEIPAEMQGESFRRIANGESSEWRDVVYYTYYDYPSMLKVKRHYGIRTVRYKLIHFYYDINEWELYDLEKDPHEMHSIYGDPAYADVQKMMHKRLVELREYYGDSDELNDKYLKTYLERTAEK